MRSKRNLWPETPSIVILHRRRHLAQNRPRDFRDADGIWASVHIEDVATPRLCARPGAGAGVLTTTGRASSSTRP